MKNRQNCSYLFALFLFVLFCFVLFVLGMIIENSYCTTLHIEVVVNWGKVLHKLRTLWLKVSLNVWVYKTKSNFARKRVIITSIYCCFLVSFFLSKILAQMFLLFSSHKRFSTTLLLSGFKFFFFTIFLRLVFSSNICRYFILFQLKNIFLGEKNPAPRSFVCVRFVKMKIGK